MRSPRLMLTLASLLMAVSKPAFAGDHKNAGTCAQRCGILCPHCGEPCMATVTKGKETKHCWEVEAKTICIPKVRFPWELCGKGCGKGCGGKDCGNSTCLPPKCGRTKCVRVLVKHEYECTVCKYSFDIDKGDKGSKKYRGAPAASAPEIPAPSPIEARQCVERR